MMPDEKIDRSTAEKERSLLDMSYATPCAKCGGVVFEWWDSETCRDCADVGDEITDEQTTLITDGGAEQSTSGADRLEKIEAHLYSAINDGDLDDVAHEHVARAYKLLGGGSGDDGDDGDDPASFREADTHGSFIARELYPDREELHQRVKEHASERFEIEGIDTSPETWEINYIGLEDGVVLYNVEHERLGTPVIEG